MHDNVMQDSTDEKHSELNHKNALKAIAKKSIFLMGASVIDTSEQIFRVYLFSKLGLGSLAGSTLIFATTRFALDPVIGLTNQNAIFVSQEFGRGKKLFSSSIQSDRITIEQNLSRQEICRNIGNIVRQGWYLGALSSIPCMGIFFSIGPILNSLKITQDVSSAVSSFFFPAAFATPLVIALNVNERFFSAVDQEKWLLPYRLGMCALNIGFNLFLIPKFGAQGGGMALLIQTSIGFLTTSLFIGFKSNFRQFEIFNFRYISGTYIKNMLKQGLPLAGALFVATGYNFAISILIGNLGELRLAVSQLAIQFFSLLTTLTHSLGEAGNRLVAQSVGQRNYNAMRYYGNVSLLSSSILFASSSIIYNIIPLQLASVFMDSDEVENSSSLIRYTFLMMSLANLLSVIQDSTSLNLAAIEDTFLSSVTSLLTTMILILPLSIASDYFTNFDIYGIIGALSIGLLASSSITATYWFSQSKKLEIDKDFETSNSKVSRLISNSFFNKCIKGKSSERENNYLLERDNDENKESSDSCYIAHSSSG